MQYCLYRDCWLWNNSVGAIWGTEIVQSEITGQISDAIGPSAAESVVALGVLFLFDLILWGGIYQGVCGEV